MEQIPYWGIDGCKAGWFCVGLPADGRCHHFVCGDIAEAYARLRKFAAKIALIDIPIGLPESEYWRDCDSAARRFVGGRRHSVFPVPCRRAVEKYNSVFGDVEFKKRAAEIVQLGCIRRNLQPTGWSIFPKVAEVSYFLSRRAAARDLFREVHLEVCFCALNGAPLSSGKKDRAGVRERRDILQKHFPNAEKMFAAMRACYFKSRAENDDIWDALAAAITAKKGFGRYQTLPENPPKDSRGLPMEMVYWSGG